MMKKILVAGAMALTLPVAAAPGAATPDTVEVKSILYYSPLPVKGPVMIDSVDIKDKKIDRASALLKRMPRFSDQPTADAAPATTPLQTEVAGLGFSLENRSFAKARILVDGADHYLMTVDGRPAAAGEEMQLTPATHKVELAWLRQPGDTAAAPRISYVTATPEKMKVREDRRRMYTLEDVLRGRRVRSVAVSPSGRYMLARYEEARSGGQIDRYSMLIGPDAKGSARRERADAAWMPSTDRYYYTAEGIGGRELRVVDAATGNEEVMAWNLPEGYFMITPDERTLIYYVAEEGYKENPDVYRISEPEDRQPGWRNRGKLMKYDFATGMSTPLTFGNRNTGLCGLSDDGRKLLYQVSESRLEKRPTTLTSLYLLDLSDNSVMTLVEKEGFFGGAILSPDGTKVALIGSPEAYGAVGRNLPEDRIPSMYDNQLYVLDVATKAITPLTRDFDPSVDNVKWNRNDGNIYFIASDRDRRSLFRVNPTSGKIDNLNAKEDYVMSFSLSNGSNDMVYVGQGAVNSDRLYSLNTKNLRQNLIEDLSAERLDGVMLGECKPWIYKSSRGDSICGRYILPPDFDPTRKYPMIVNYYGGCSPTSRTFESRYPHHVYAAHGYVVLVINPSGSAGFGQEFASRHVNTAGEGVAEDIIEGVRQFIKANPWVDASKIGCIGASYGGFMTQYLQTKTDLFAAAISHAGISDHTSYWGEGYWGYSYSEVSMAKSYPWSHSDLYVKQSPLYNADKIHTPILFLHGDSDTNVPFGESIQMYTALKLLGRETAFVAVRDANHQVTEFNKRKQWQETIFAWFAKYLQDDESWWESLYPKKILD